MVLDTKNEVPMLDEVDELSRLLRPIWPEYSEAARSLSFHPRPLFNEVPGDDDDVEDADVDEDEDEDDDSDEGGDRSRRRAGGDGGGDEEDDDEGGDRENVSKSELERLRRIAKESEARAKKAEREASKRKERERKEAGEWEELLKERDEKIGEAEAERDEARFELTSYKRQIRVTTAASRLGFKDPSDAIRFVTEDETEDDNGTERALKRVLREKPYLASERRSSGAPVTGDSKSSLTADDIKKMSQEEINARWDEVQRVLQAGG